MKTNLERLSAFAFHTRIDNLPPQVLEEGKRLLVDSLGCGLAGHIHPKGAIGVRFAELQGPGAPGEQATVLGTKMRVSSMAAAFANGELINALDYDAVLPPGHVSPYVIPAALAAAEAAGAQGSDLLCAVALSHEISNRIGKALDYLRDMKNGVAVPPPVLGYSCTVFGAAAAVGRVRAQTLDQMTHAMAIAGSMAPVNTQWSWSVHSPTASVKYGITGAVTQAAMTAAYLSELGHTGDIQVLDDGEHGFRRLIGSIRWSPEDMMSALGDDWFFPREQTYKPYPHCRILHAPLDVLAGIIRDNDIQPEEIESIRAWVEAWVLKPLWTNRKIEHVTQAQFSIAHGLALGAHRFPPGKEWQLPEVVFNPSVIALMDKVHFEIHPDYASQLAANPASRPARIEVRARGRTFTGESLFPRGSVTPDPATRLTNDDLSEKFIRNAQGVLNREQIDQSLRMMWELEMVEDVRSLVALLSGDH